MQVCGACVYVALVSRLLLPWYTADYALEQLADALEQSALLYGRIYASQLERMRLAELVAGQIKQGGPEALQVHVDAAPSPAATTPAGAKEPAGPIQNSGDASGTAVPPQDQQLPPAIALAACEAAEAKLLVVLRQQVLSRLVAVQLSLAKESVSWRRGVLATPPLVLNVLGAMNAVKEALASQRLALAPFTKHGAASMTEQPGTAGAGAGSGMLHMMEHCYSMWALPLHPLWLEVSCSASAVMLREEVLIAMATALHAFMKSSWITHRARTLSRARYCNVECGANAVSCCRFCAPSVSLRPPQLHTSGDSRAAAQRAQPPGQS